MPKQEGKWTGTIEISDGNETQKANITINVAGDELKDGGISESWRMSRISWLDSDKGCEDTIVPPFTPIKVNGNKISIYKRNLELDPLGFPTQISANNIKILKKPVDFGLYENGKKLVLSPISKKVIKQNEAVYQVEYISGNDKVELTVITKVEFDGFVGFDVKLKALKDISLSDVELFVPYVKEVAKYGMGLAYRGSYAPKFWEWQWDNEGGKYLAWLGDYDAGLQIKLEPKGHPFVTGGSFSTDKYPEGWYNDNKGKITLSSERDYYSYKATGGDKFLRAGETCDYDFRLLITPFKNASDQMFKYREGTGAHENTQLIFHAQRGNTFINYPFVENKYLKGLIDSVIDYPIADACSLKYPLDNVTGDKGSMTLWVENTFDWADHAIQEVIANINMDHQRFGIYYQNFSKNMGMQSLNWTGDNLVGTAKHMFVNTLPIDNTTMKKGDKHIINMAWDSEGLRTYLDGVQVGFKEAPFIVNQGPILSLSLTDRVFSIRAIRFDNDINLDSEIKPGANTILFDQFTETYDNGDLKPEIGNRGEVDGDYTIKDGYLSMKDLGVKDIYTDLYYTSRELSNHCQEIWVLRSLGDEIFNNRGFVYTLEGATELTEDGGGYQWLYEQLQSGYIPAWHMKLSNGEHCAAISTKYDSRWLNFYVEGVDYFMKELGMRGIYLDGIGYGRETMKRVARVMAKNRPDYSINFHAGNDYDYLNHRANPCSTYMEHFPYITSCWIGEMYDYDRAPEYWFTEITGTPFGVPSEQLVTSISNCNPYRGMIYGMAGRNMQSTESLYKLWDKWEIQNAEPVGYWDKKPLVKIEHGQDKVLATVYKQKGKALIAIANWDNDNDITVNIKPDYTKLGLNKQKVKITAPRIVSFQDYKEYDSLDNITIPAGKGFIFEVKE